MNTPRVRSRSTYQPFSCERQRQASIDDETTCHYPRMSMRWAPIEALLSGLAIPEGIYFEQLGRSGIDEVIQRLRVWYPDIAVGAESRHLDREFYEREYSLAAGDEDRRLYGFVCRGTDSGEMVGFMSLEKNVRARQIWSPMGAVEPTKRGAGIGQFGAVILEHVGRAIGAEVAFYQVTLKTNRQQKNAQRHGFKLCGILPAIDRDEISPGLVRRVYEGVYVKVLAPPSEVELPLWANLEEPARKLWRAVFGEHPDDR
jgi:hypothetical protein